MTVALISGVPGQDSSFLAEHLVDDGMKVYGVIRRSARNSLGAFDHPSFLIKDKITLIEADATDYKSMESAFHYAAADSGEGKVDQHYCLFAQSHVGSSHKAPSATIYNNTIGTINSLDAFFHVNDECGFKYPRAYFAATSECFSGAPETAPQDESTPYEPQSPYAISKVAGVHYCEYLRQLGRFVGIGILFNHECLSFDTPIMIRRNGFIEIIYIGELIAYTNYRDGGIRTFEIKDTEVWDGEQWTEIKLLTATRRLKKDTNHDLVVTQARGGIVTSTKHHNLMLSEEEQVAAVNIEKGDHLLLGENPKVVPKSSTTDEMAELFGLLVSDGYVNEKGRIRFCNNDLKLRDRAIELVQECFGPLHYRHRNNTSESTYGRSEYVDIYLHDGCCAGRWIREQIYSKDKKKKIPNIIINASTKIIKAFLKGYYAGDGLKAGDSESVKTNSTLLAQGLVFLYGRLGRKCSTYVEQRDDHQYYQLNIESVSGKGTHLKQSPTEFRRQDDSVKDSRFVFDLETESGVFQAGVGRLVVHNSPRRPEEFVTRKVVRSLCKIKLGQLDRFGMGNLDSSRDWSHARDMTRGMIQILNHDTPENFVLASGETHTIKDLIVLTMQILGLPGEIEDYIYIDPRFVRPTEVWCLKGNPTKAKEVLGWKPKYTFQKMIQEMVEWDLKILEG